MIARGPRSHTQLDSTQERRYTSEFDARFRQGWRSDIGSIALRLAVISVSFALLARAITTAQLGPGYVALPFVVEVLVVMWLGWALARTVVNEPVFRKVAGPVWVPIGWTIAAAVPYLLVLLGQSEGGWRGVSTLASAWFDRAWASGLLLALLAVMFGLVMDTVSDLRRWRAGGQNSVFVWPATMQIGFRFAAMIALPLALVIPAIVLGSFAHMLCGGSGNSEYVGDKEFVAVESCLGISTDLSFTQGMSWILFAWLLAAELIVLFGVSWLHRRELRKSQARDGTVRAHGT